RRAPPWCAWAPRSSARARRASPACRRGESDETSCVKPEARHGCAGARPSDGGCGGPYRGPPRRAMSVKGKKVGFVGAGNMGEAGGEGGETRWAGRGAPRGGGGGGRGGGGGGGPGRAPPRRAMSVKGKKVGFVGAGNMGEALIRGLVESNLVPPDKILVADVR